MAPDRAPEDRSVTTAPAGSAPEVFRAFLALGCTGFGGPVAHIGYFHEAFVRRRGWIPEERFAAFVALAQLLPGPASSQVGMAIGHARAGLPGLFAAWAGFTLPSALLMSAAALGVGLVRAEELAPVLRGLALAALAAVANALAAMAARQTGDVRRASVFVLAAVAAVLLPGLPGQFAALALGALAGLLGLCGRPEPAADGAAGADRPAARAKAGIPWLVAFAALLVLLPLLRPLLGVPGALADGMYRAGSLVFGGGHVILPLLRNEFVGDGLLSEPLFVAGYGLAQAVPGPLLSFSAYVGTVATGGSLLGGLLAVVAVFAPSWLLVAGSLPLLEALRRHRRALAALAGVEAAVTGLLLAALYDPVFVHAVHGHRDFALALLAVAALALWRVPVWLLVPLCALAGPLL